MFYSIIKRFTINNNVTYVAFQNYSVLLKKMFWFGNAAVYQNDSESREEMRSQGQTVVKNRQPTAVPHDA